MSVLVLDAGAFVAAERNQRSLIAKLRVAQQRGAPLRTNAVVVAQVWRDPQGRQAALARLLRGVDVRPVDESMGREAGVLQGRTRTSDPVDATLVLVARSGDRILTSDPDDLRLLAGAAGLSVAVIRC